jgi:hypothetical protein
MAAVLQFEQKHKSGNTTAVLSGPAEIIIFPGVRFERLDSSELQILPEDGKPNGSGPMQHRAAR